MTGANRFVAVRYMLHQGNSFAEEDASEDECNHSDSSTETISLRHHTRGKHRNKFSKRSMPVGKWSKYRNVDDTLPDFHVTLHQAARDGDVELLRIFLDHLSPEAAHMKVNELDENKLAPLHYAARYNHTDVVELLLCKGADVNVQGEDGLTPLHFAARYGYDKLLRQQASDESALPGACQTVICMLVSNGASVNCKDNYGMTPLHYSSTRGNEVATELLLKCPHINTEEYDKQEMTPLHCAAYYSHTGVVELLLLADAEPRVDDENMSTPLHLAASTGNSRIVSFLLDTVKRRYGIKDLLEYIERRNNSMCTALHLAVNKSDLEIVEILLDAGADVQAKRDHDDQPIHLAAVSGNVSVAKCLVGHGAQVNASNAFRETPLHKAAGFNAVEVIKFLLSNNANIECRDNSHFTPLLIASAEGHKDAVETLLAAGADITAVDKLDQSCVYWASKQNHPEALEVLLSHANGAELVNRCDRYDNTPVHVASFRGYDGIVKVLQKYSAVLCRKNENERTALHMAALNGHVHVAEFLIKCAKYMLNCEDENSNTPLHLAAHGGHEEMVTLLISSGATIDARNCSKWTPLDCAASKGWKRCCQTLLSSGCPVNGSDKSKTSPLHLAAREGHMDVLKLLLKWGADVSHCDKNGKNCLDLAIDRGHEDIAFEILSCPDWEKVLRNESDKNKFGMHQTPLRRLIRRMPDVAEFVFGKCIKKNEFPEDHPKFEITYNYEFLDDVFACYQKNLYDIIGDVSSSSSSSSSSNSYSISELYDDEGHVRENAKPYSDDKDILKYNHPLMLMVTYNRQSLLNHPLCLSLLHHKWENYGRYVYYMNLLIFVVFLMLLTTYILTALPPCPEEDVSDPKCCWFINSTCQPFIGDCKFMDHQQLPEMCRNFIYVLAVVHLLKEAYQMYQNGIRYINFENFLEWSCYLSALFFVADMTQCSEKTGIREVWQWELGAISIFLAWMVLVMFISKFPFLGIYVIMFIQILSTFVNFSFVFFLFVVAFALAFYTLLQNQDPFESVGESLIKTSVMMIGELEFDNIFNDPDSHVYFKGPSYLLFVLFLLIMTIIIMNLLVGLAVDDIKGVQEQAQLKRLAMKVELVLTVERILPVMALRRWVIKHKTLRPNCSNRLPRLLRMLGIQTGIQSASATSVFKSSLEELEEKQVELSRQLKHIQESLHFIQKDMKHIKSFLEKR